MSSWTGGNDLLIGGTGLKRWSVRFDPRGIDDRVKLARRHGVCIGFLIEDFMSPS